MSVNRQTVHYYKRWQSEYRDYQRSKTEVYRLFLEGKTTSANKNGLYITCVISLSFIVQQGFTNEKQENKKKGSVNSVVICKEFIVKHLNIN